jgi:glycosyltransferase involved in cell wall biosynthesis
MKIGIEAQRLFRNKKHGMEVVALEIIKQLQILDKLNEYVIFVRQGDDNCLSETSNFRIELLSANNYIDWEQIKLPRAVKKEKLDILHCTANTAPVNLEVPIILTLHDIIFLEPVKFTGNAYQFFGNLYRRFILSRIIPNCKKIITVSKYEKKAIVANTIATDVQVEVVYNGVNPNFSPLEQAQLDEFRVDNKLPRRFILFFGNTAVKKNTMGLLKAYSAYIKSDPKGLPLVIAGAFKQHILKLVDSLHLPEGLKNKILVLDHIAFNDQPKLYNLATLFVYPSFRESFGLPILEAMACGTPVITSNTAAMPEIAGDAAYFIDPNSPDEIALAFKNLLSNDSAIVELVLRGRTRAINFGWEIAARKTLGLYESVVAESAH